MRRKESKEIIMGLDVSTKCIGVCLMDTNGVLQELTHISPKVKPVPDSKTEELILKSKLFDEFIQKYNNEKFNIKKIIIEEPLLQSNNAYTAGTLLRFNGMICKVIYERFGVTPDFISTYDARKHAFPELVQPNAKNKMVLFGAYPKDIDKKMVIWGKVNEQVKKTNDNAIQWLLNNKGELKKENFDMADSVACTIGYLRMNGYI
jgi:RNase H-fold protein (predicted Holliday junction resolvase)